MTYLDDGMWKSCNGTGPWWAVSFKDMNWWIWNEITGRRRKIGPVRLKGTNYFDRAVEEADRRNKALRVLPVVWMNENQQEWFYNLWDNNQDMYEFLKLANDVTPVYLSQSVWEEAWSKYLILHEVRDYGMKEFIAAVNWASSEVQRIQEVNRAIQ